MLDTSGAIRAANATDPALAATWRQLLDNVTSGAVALVGAGGRAYRCQPVGGGTGVGERSAVGGAWGPVAVARAPHRPLLHWTLLTCPPQPPASSPRF